MGREGHNPVAREVGGGGLGESSFPGGEGEESHIPYTFSHWNRDFSSVKSTKMIFLVITNS